MHRQQPAQKRADLTPSKEVSLLNPLSALPGTVCSFFSPASFNFHIGSLTVSYHQQRFQGLLKRKWNKSTTKKSWLALVMSWRSCFLRYHNPPILVVQVTSYLGYVRRCSVSYHWKNMDSYCANNILSEFWGYKKIGSVLITNPQLHQSERLYVWIPISQ